MIAKLKSIADWMKRRIRKHPFLSIISIIGLGFITYYVILPAIVITTLSVGIVAAAACVILGAVLGGFLGWLGQKVGLIKPDPLPAADQKFEKYQQLPDGIKRIICGHLDNKNLKNFAETSKAMNQVSKPLLSVAKFLQHVARGDQDQAEAMLQEEAKLSPVSVDLRDAKRDFQVPLSSSVSAPLCPPASEGLSRPALAASDDAAPTMARRRPLPSEGSSSSMTSSAVDAKEAKRTFISSLLTTKGRATDCSGRTFTDVTALKLAFWAKDRHMWQMLLIYLPADKALKQYKEHEQQGVSYKVGNKKIINEKHFDFFPLINALQQYVNYIGVFNTPVFSSAEADRRWFEVGKAQCYTPIHVAYEYTREDRSFDPLPRFDEQTLPRPRIAQMYHWPAGKLDAWFSLHFYAWFYARETSYSFFRGGI